MPPLITRIFSSPTLRLSDVSEVQWWCDAVSSGDRLAALAALYRSTAAGLSLPRSKSRPLHQALIATLFRVS